MTCIQAPMKLLLLWQRQRENPTGFPLFIPCIMNTFAILPILLRKAGSVLFPKARSRLPTLLR